jgi:hypothetical protein
VTTVEEVLGELGEVFSVWSVSRCYKQDKSRVWLVIRELTAGENVSTEAADIV